MVVEDSFRVVKYHLWPYRPDVEHKTRVFSAVCWPFGKRVMELLILDKKERGAESQYYSGESGESRG